MEKKALTPWEMALKHVKPLANDEDKRNVIFINDCCDDLEPLFELGVQKKCFKQWQVDIFRVCLVVYPDPNDHEVQDYEPDKVCQLYDAMGVTKEEWKRL